MGEVVNLNRVKKARRRSERTAEAAQNRVRHGLGKAAKQSLVREREREARRHEQGRLDGEKPEGGAT